MKTKKPSKKKSVMKTKKPSKKKSVMKTKKAKCQITGIAAKILEDKGEKWVKNTCGTDKPTTAHNIANLVYYHYLESDEGEQVWGVPGQNEGKVDYIFDSIYDKYIHDLEWMTEKEWVAGVHEEGGLADNLYNMVYEGVF